MRVPEAIAALRQHLDLKQEAFAELLGVTITSISRYENGRPPSRTVLKKLADAAEKARRKDLSEFFNSEWKASIIARLKNLRSAGTERSVPLDDLKRWSEMATIIQKTVGEALDSYKDLLSRYPAKREQVEGTHRMLGAIERNLAKDLAKSIKLYITIPATKGNKT